MTEWDDWKAAAASLLKAELKQREVTYAELARRIGASETGIRHKLSRGTFSAAFLLRCLTALGVSELRLEPK